LRKEVEMCGDGWKTENGVLLFIYTPVITVSLASNSFTNIPLVARYHYPLSHYCSFGAVFALISFRGEVTLNPKSESVKLLDFKRLGVEVPEPKPGVSEGERDYIGEISGEGGISVEEGGILVYRGQYMLP